MSFSDYKKHLLVLKFVNNCKSWSNSASKIDLYIMLALFANARTSLCSNCAYTDQNGCNNRGSQNLNLVAISGIFLCLNFTEGASSVQCIAMFI